VTYDAVPGSALTFSSGLTRPPGPALADLTLFEISGSPGLTNLTLASSEPATGTTVQMIGFGEASGFNGTRSWGNNTINQFGSYQLDSPDQNLGGMGIVTLASGEGGNGGQGVGGDSGGGEFVAGTLELAGILSGVGDIGSDGEGTVAVDLSYDSSEITAEIDTFGAIPEPADWAAILGFAALGCAVFGRFRSLERSGRITLIEPDRRYEFAGEPLLALTVLLRLAGVTAVPALDPSPSRRPR